MIDQIINKYSPDFEKVMAHYEHELSAIRTGRANPALLSTVMVESYGARMSLEQVASVSVSEAKTVVISPWDKGQLQAVEKGIQAANLGFNPSNDGIVIRITLPPMNEERRKEMVKLIGQMSEQAKVGIRKVREDVIKTIKRGESDGEISKDDVSFAQKKVQEVVDKYNDMIKSGAQDKEKEVMTV